jgi:hypothetical protein
MQRGIHQLRRAASLPSVTFHSVRIFLERKILSAVYFRQPIPRPVNARHRRDLPCESTVTVWKLYVLERMCHCSADADAADSGIIDKSQP